VKGNEAKPRVIRQNENPARARSNGRGLGNPHLAADYAGQIGAARFSCHRTRENCSLLSTRENHPDRGSLSLWPERCPILIFKNKAAGRAYGKRIEDTFVSLTCNRAHLAAFPIDEANDRSCWGRRSRSARRPGWTTWFLAAVILALVVFVSAISQCRAT